MLPCRPEHGRKEIRKVEIGQSGIAVSWAWVKVEGKERVLRVVELDGRHFDSFEIASELIEAGHLERLHCRHGGNDAVQGLENMPWQV